MFGCVRVDRQRERAERQEKSQADRSEREWEAEIQLIKSTIELDSDKGKGQE